MRPTDVPDQGLLCDLLWSDPDKETMGWGENDRGVSFTFGAEVVAKFLHKHDLDLICRAHQVWHWSMNINRKHVKTTYVLSYLSGDHDYNTQGNKILGLTTKYFQKDNKLLSDGKNHLEDFRSGLCKTLRSTGH